MATVSLKAATREDLQAIWEMQIAAFSELLDKYQDYDMSPGAEGLEKIIARYEQPWTVYYLIVAENENVGVIRVIDKKDTSRKRISPIWIMPEYRNKGYAQAAIFAVEQIHVAITGAWTRYCKKQEIFICTKRWAIIRPEEWIKSMIVWTLSSTKKIKHKF